MKPSKIRNAVAFCNVNEKFIYLALDLAFHLVFHLDLAFHLYFSFILYILNFLKTQVFRAFGNQSNMGKFTIETVL